MNLRDSRRIRARPRRQVALTEAQVTMLAVVLDRVLTGVGLDPADPSVRSVVHAELLAAADDGGAS